jgi:hypothetical protein
VFFEGFCKFFLLGFGSIVAWAWLKGVGRNSQGNKEVVLNSGCVLLNIAQACWVRTSHVDDVSELTSALLAAGLLMASDGAYRGFKEACAANRGRLWSPSRGGVRNRLDPSAALPSPVGEAHCLRPQGSPGTTELTRLATA